MARLPRLDVPGVAQHVIQRGHNREACFASEQDFAAYASWLHEYAVKLSVDIHAWVFMTNHVHFLMTPHKPGAVSTLMQSVGRRYVPYFNFTYKRSGTLWGGRFKSSLVESKKYMLECHRYIELNPVRAGMVESPAEYKWSSYKANAMGVETKLVTPHPEYLGLGSSSVSRQAKYKRFFEGQVHPDLLHTFRHNTQKGFVIGSPAFEQQIATLVGRRVTEGQRGRPSREALIQ